MIYFTYTESLIGLTIFACLVLIPAVILIALTGEAVLLCWVNCISS